MYLVYGNSLVEIKEKINKIIETINTNNVIKYNYTETDIDLILEDACYLSMFDDKKCIVISDCIFLTSKEKDSINTDKLLRYIKNPNEKTITKEKVAV